MNLANKRILLTGATGGIGELIALKLAKKGAILALVGRNHAKLTALQSQYPCGWWQGVLHYADLNDCRIKHARSQ